MMSKTRAGAMVHAISSDGVAADLAGHRRPRALSKAEEDPGEEPEHERADDQGHPRDHPVHTLDGPREIRARHERGLRGVPGRSRRGPSKARARTPFSHERTRAQRHTHASSTTGRELEERSQQDVGAALDGVPVAHLVDAMAASPLGGDEDHAGVGHRGQVLRVVTGRGVHAQRGQPRVAHMPSRWPPAREARTGRAPWWTAGGSRRPPAGACPPAWPASRGTPEGLEHRGIGLTASRAPARSARARCSSRRGARGPRRRW